MNGTYTQRRTTQRQNYGLGDLVGKIGERFRKLIPNEIANVAAKAAPFVAPFNPLAAGIMRGVGRYDKRGDFGDALKQGLLTYGGGQAARYLGGAGMQTGIDPRGGMGGGMLTSPMGTQSGIRAMMSGTRAPDFVKGISQKESIFKKAMDFAQAPFKALGEMDKGKAMLTVGAIGTGVSYVVDKLVGPKDPGETMEEYMTRRKSTMSEYLRYYYKNVNPLASADEVEQFVTTNTREYSSQGGRIGYDAGGNYEAKIKELMDRGLSRELAEALVLSGISEQNYEVMDKAQGGRIGYKYGSGIKSLDAGAPSITYEGDMKTASAPDPMDALNDMSIEVYGKPLHQLTPEQYQMLIDMANEQAAAPREKRAMVAIGGLPTIPGIPRMAPDGLEYDMSQNGGFQPLGAQEGKDDVKANLAKNEFVFTADAVRGAGDGDIEKGAQRMYDTMKRLEGRVA